MQKRRGLDKPVQECVEKSLARAQRLPSRRPSATEHGNATQLPPPLVLPSTGGALPSFATAMETVSSQSDWKGDACVLGEGPPTTEPV